MSDMQTVIRRLIELGRTDLAEVAAKCEAELAAANDRIERLCDDVHYAWQTEREVRAKLAAFEDSCRRVVARRKEDGAFIVLTVDLEHIESMLATTVAAPAVPDGAAVAALEAVAQQSPPSTDSHQPAADNRHPRERVLAQDAARGNFRRPNNDYQNDGA